MKHAIPMIIFLICVTIIGIIEDNHYARINCVTDTECMEAYGDEGY